MFSKKFLIATALVAALVAGPVMAQEATDSMSEATAVTVPAPTKAKVAHKKHAAHHAHKKAAASKAVAQ